MTDAKMQFPHRRFDPLRGRWVLVSPHRTQRPWQGEVSRTDAKPALHYDPECYLCPGNTRAGGHQNPKYTNVFAFANDYAALLPDAPDVVPETGSDLLRAESECGLCRVLCFHPDHSLTLRAWTWRTSCAWWKRGPPSTRSWVRGRKSSMCRF